MIDLGDAVPGDDFSEARGVEHVERFVVAGAGQAGGRDVGGDDVVGAELERQGFDEFAADLAVGADDEDAFHDFVLKSFDSEPALRREWRE